jgi:tRNA pseudouridine55 synthase
MYGFLNLNKPLGCTSHDCVAKIRRLLKIKRVGHAGTLDPLASGVLPIAVGSATRLLQFLPTGKAYRARIRLGQVTTTDDLEGDILASTPAPNLTFDRVQAELQTFLGTIQQVPPIYSAIQMDGQRLYKRAIAGETPEIPPRTVEIFAINLLNWYPGEFPELDVEIACGSGTYIRAIARDLGQRLGCGGTLAGLIRTASSGFELSTSLTLEDVTAQLEQGTVPFTIADHAIGHLPAVQLEAELAYRWCLGQTVLGDLSLQPGQENAFFRLYDPQQEFLGIAQGILSSPEQIALKPKVVLRVATKILGNND